MHPLVSYGTEQDDPSEKRKIEDDIEKRKNPLNMLARS